MPNQATFGKTKNWPIWNHAQFYQKNGNTATREALACLVHVAEYVGGLWLGNPFNLVSLLYGKLDTVSLKLSTSLYSQKGWLALPSQPFPHPAAKGTTQADEHKRRSPKDWRAISPGFRFFLE